MTILSYSQDDLRGKTWHQTWIGEIGWEGKERVLLGNIYCDLPRRANNQEIEAALTESLKETLSAILPDHFERPTLFGFRPGQVYAVYDDELKGL